MEISDKNIDQLFKDNLTDLNLEFNATDWAILEKRLKEKRKRKLFLWWFFGVGSFTIALISIAIFKTKEMPTSQESNRVELAINDTLLQGIKERNTGLMKMKSDSIQLSHLTSNSERLNSKESPFDYKEKKSSASFINSSVSQNKSAKNLLSLNDNLRNNNQIDSSDTLSSNMLEIQPNKIKLENKNLTDEKKDSSASILTKNIKLDTLHLIKIPYQSFDIPSNEIDTLHKIIPSISKSEFVPKKGIGFEIHPNITYNFSQPSLALTGNKSEVFGEYGKNINLGVNYTFLSNNKVDFIAGIYYSKISYNIQSLYNLYPLEPVQYHVYEIASEKSEFSFLNFRFDINYFLNRKKWSPYFSVAPSLNFNLISKSQITFGERIEYNEAKTKFFSPSLNLGFGINRELNSNWNIYFQPNFEIYPIPTVYHFEDEFTRPFSIGVKVGLRKKWKKK